MAQPPSLQILAQGEEGMAGQQQIGRARGDDEEDAQIGEPRREVGEQIDRRRVRPMHVVEEQHERPGA